MKQRSLKKRLVALVTTVLTLVMCMAGTMSAYAVDEGANVNNGIFTFTKYLVMEEDANVPNVTFDFTIEAGKAMDADGTNPAIYEGIGTPTVTTAEFTAADTTTTGKPDNASATDYKYVTKEVNVDFSGVDFTAPGIYRYTITEKNESASGITYDASVLTMDVYVQYKDETTADLEVKYCVLHDDTDNPNTAAKSEGFINEYDTSNLILEKQVTGNQGNRDKYFEFTVTISNAVPGTVYDVDLTGASWNSTPANPAKLTVESTGTVSGKFYLNDDDKIIIQGMTSDTEYTIEEADYTTDGYSTSYVLDSSTSTTSNIIGAETMGDKDHTVTFTNNKQGTVPTGVLLETAPYIILGVVVIAGFVVLFATRRRRSR